MRFLRSLPALSLLTSIGVFSQNATSTVVTEKETKISGATRQTITTETTTNLLPPYDVTIKKTSEFSAAAAGDAAVAIQKTSEIVNTTDKATPQHIIDYQSFRGTRIYLLKSEVKDNLFQYTYIDRADNTLKIFTTPIVPGTREVVTHYQTSGLWQLNAPVSLVTIPFKIRPDIQGLGQKAQATTNLGVTVPLGAMTWNRLFADTGTSKHQVSLNVLAAPSIEDVDAANSNGNVPAKRSTVVLSGGISVTYMYNDISFSVIPAATDIGLNSVGKNWVYNRRYWWGFGIGVTPTFLWRVFK